MSKKKQKKKSQVQNKPQEKKRTGIPFLNNVLVLLIVFVVVSYFKKNNTGYKWVADTLIENNLKLIKRYKNLTFKEKQAAKMGSSVNYVHYINEHTTEDALVLLPPDSIIYNRDVKGDFDVNLVNRTWVHYFCYPRKLIYKGDTISSIPEENASDIGIVNGWGYQLLDYEVPQKIKHGVFPVKPKKIN